MLADMHAEHACCSISDHTRLDSQCQDPHSRAMLRRLSHSEAALMDPQSRILLEQTSLALGAAGGQSSANTGVYVGVMHMEYIQHITGRLCPATHTPSAGLA